MCVPRWGRYASLVRVETRSVLKGGYLYAATAPTDKAFAVDQLWLMKTLVQVAAASLFANLVLRLSVDTP